MTSAAPSPILVILSLIAVQVLFGVNYVISKVVVGAFPPLVWASIRIIIATAVMALTAIGFSRPFPKGGSRFFGPLVIFALLGCVINQSSFLVGLKYTTSTNSAILNTLIPVFTLLIVTLRGQEPLTFKRAVGFLAALAGVLVIRKVEEFSLSNETVIGDLLTILNCLSYALFLSYGKEFMQRNDRVWTTTLMFAYGSVGLTLLAVPSYMEFHPPEFTATLVACMSFSIIGATLLTYFLNNFALAHTRSSSVALFIYLQPVIAALMAWLWKGEPVTARTALSCGLIFLGMLLALSQPAQAAGVKASPLPSPSDG